MWFPFARSGELGLVDRPARRQHFKNAALEPSPADAALDGVRKGLIRNPSVRTDKQLFTEPFSNLLPCGWRQFVDRFARRRYRRTVRVPEIIEVRVHDGNADDAGFDRLETRIFPQPSHGIGSGDRRARRTWSRHPQRFHRDVDWMNGRSG